jgi:hypothetical protein
MIIPVFLFAVSFWVVQLVDLLRRDVSNFESHTHKLVWFVAFMVGNILAAWMYYHWKKTCEFSVRIS